MTLLYSDKYTHLILDVVLGDGMILSILPNIRNLFPGIKIAVYTVQPAEVYAPIIKEYGIDYYISKASAEEESWKLLLQFLNDESPPINTTRFFDPQNPFAKLNPTELQCLHYLLKRHSTKEMSNILSLSSRRILQIKNEIFEKVEAGDFSQLQELAMIFKVS